VRGLSIVSWSRKQGRGGVSRFSPCTHARMQRAGFFFTTGTSSRGGHAALRMEVAHRSGSRPHHPRPGPGKGQPLHQSIRRSIARQLMHMHAHIDRHKLFMLQQKKLPENNNIETASNPSPSPFLSPLPLHTSLLSSWKPTQVNQSLSQHPVACLV
jgi:hypothetical protein